MKKHVFCTSMSDKGYKQYGKKMLESWMGHNQQLPLWVFYNGSCPAIPGPTYLNLAMDEELSAFIHKWSDYAAAHGIIGRDGDKLIADYKWQAMRFAWKAFSVTSPARPKSEWWVWLDADTVIEKPFDGRFFNETMPDDVLLSYLARKGTWAHSECGFVAYRHSHPVMAQFLTALRRLYTTGDLFLKAEWHDSSLVDGLLRTTEWDMTKDLSAGITEGLHPWPHTILGEYIRHNKGLLKNG